MHPLEQRHRGERAVVIFGGPSLIANRFDFSGLKALNAVTFLESKALTPAWLNTGIVPDYYLMFYPEKAKDNAFQHFVYSSFLAETNIRPLVTSASAAVVDDMRSRFDECFDIWRPDRGAHKRLRWKPGAYLRNSPYDLLRFLPGVEIIAGAGRLKEHFPQFDGPNEIHEVELVDNPGQFSQSRYYSASDSAGRVRIESFGSQNSSAIGLYPLLSFMGFRQVFLLGMDMSMLGSMEYAAPFTFRSMLHFWWFFQRTHRVFNSAYTPNRPYYLRPAQEKTDLTQVLQHPTMEFVRVWEEFKYSTAISGVRSMSYDQFLAI